MAELVMSNAERQAWIDAVRSRLTSGNIGLYVNDPQLTGNTTLADFVEASFPGYMQAGLQGAPEVTVNSATGRHQLVWAEVSFRQNAPAAEQLVRGYFVTNNSGTLAWSQRFDQLKSFATAQDLYRMIPVVQLWSLPTV